MKKQISALIVWSVVGTAVPMTANAETIGLALTGWRYALYETEYAKEECPDGLQIGERDQWKAIKNFDEHQAKLGGSFKNRGVNGETADNNPLMVEDAVPFREFKAAKGYGLNLDGTPDGRATAKTCAHSKFINPEGEKVDNQIQRVVGCVQGWRTGGQMSEYQAEEFVTRPINRILVEVGGVDNETNDPSVDVTFYKGRDALVKSTAGENKYIPYTRQRVDNRMAQYTYKTAGKIVDGVLITDPIPTARLSSIQETQYGDRLLKDMTLRLKLTTDGGEGYVAGYENIETWFNTHAKKAVSDVGLYSSAALYRALLRYADGYPDAQGQCGYISSNWKVAAVRAMIVHPKKEQRRVAEKDDGIRLASAN